MNTLHYVREAAQVQVQHKNMVTFIFMYGQYIASSIIIETMYINKR